MRPDCSPIKWHCTIDGKKCGPVSTQELHSWVADGRCKPTDQIWTDGMDDWAPCNSIEEFKCTIDALPVQQQDNRKAKAGMVLGIVGLPLVLLSPVPMYLALFCLIIPIACVFICLWTGGVVCAIVGLCLSVAGKRKALETNSGEMMAITGVALSCITLGVMAIEIIFIMFIARLAG